MNTQDNALVVKKFAEILKQADEEAGELLSALVADARGVAKVTIIDEHGNPIEGEAKEGYLKSIREAVKQNPGTALAVIDKEQSKTGLSPMMAARAIDQVIGLGASDEETTERIKDKVRGARIIELLESFGDLDSSLALIAGQDLVFDAMVGNSFDVEDSGLVYFRLLGWARKLKEREDWEEMLDRKVGATHETLEYEILRAIFCLHADRGSLVSDRYDDEEVDSDEITVPADLFEECGVDPASNFLTDIQEEYEALDADTIAAARRVYKKQRNERKKQLQNVKAHKAKSKVKRGIGI